MTAAHPRLIHLWVPPYGTTGEWSDLPAHHASLTGLSGMAFRQGSYADQPIWYVAPLVHYAQATLAAAAVGAALLERSASGLGQAVVVSGLHAMAETACPLGAMGGGDRGGGHPLGGGASYRLYQCGDGKWLFLGTLFSHFFANALEALDLSYGEAWDIGSAIQDKLLSGPREHWLALFREHDAPAGPVDRRVDWLASDIARANALGLVLNHPTLGPVEMPGVLARLGATPGSVRHFLDEATPKRLTAFATPRPPLPAAASKRPALPLAGVRVLDLGTVVAGAYASAILANFGADVVKVEPAEGDPFRSGGPGFMNYNRGKRGLGVNLKRPEGLALFLDLAKRADVVLDNYRLGVRERLGIDYAALKAVNPRIVSCSANTYGSRGADARLPGFDPLLQARSGMMAAQGGEDGEPVFHTIPINDVATAALTAFAVIAALNAREVTGEGQNVETSLAAASTLYQFGELTTYAGRPPSPDGSRDCIGFAALDRYYRCRDGWLTLACTEAGHFAALTGALDHPEWLKRWNGEAALAAARDGTLADELAAAFRQLGRDDAVRALTGAGVPALPVMRGDEVQRTEFFWDNGYFDLHAHPYYGELIASRGFAEFNGAPARFERLHPELGEHGVEVLTDYGVPRERIVELARARVIFRG
ncbi:MAG TPA: CoA transferase [Caulobacteraceae bacterium]|jgi:crotonobetainyl-CoA:carnitine CoA-transferase CaiB-like acyl-CoA transferase|nr:CoA transferase [Caulobacteraceae bacterium]